MGQAVKSHQKDGAQIMDKLADEKIKEAMDKLRVHNELYKAIVKDWVKARSETKEDGLLFTQMSVVALSQYASVLAVDLGMSEEQFVSVCRSNFSEAYERAPKFGD